MAIGANSSVETLVEQAETWRPKVVAIADDSRAAELTERVPPGTEVLAGRDAMASFAAEADIVVNGVVGFAGLDVTMATLEAGKRLALANKESLIAAGPVVQAARRTPGAELVPVDSEHCAVHQCLRANEVTDRVRVAQIVLTASRRALPGPNARRPRRVTVDDALAHPTWRMGPKITIDSSTLMNKGLEVIEAHELFGVDYDDIDVVVHPQSIVHSMVDVHRRRDHRPALDARHASPHRLRIGLSRPDSAVPYGAIDWTELRRLDFEPPDHEAFPCLGLAYEAGPAGGTAPAWLNAANEVAVEAFLDGPDPLGRHSRRCSRGPRRAWWERQRPRSTLSSTPTSAARPALASSSTREACDRHRRRDPRSATGPPATEPTTQSGPSPTEPHGAIPAGRGRLGLADRCARWRSVSRSGCRSCSPCSPSSS